MKPSRALSEDSVARLLDTIYEAALTPDAWPLALAQLAELFDCHFADLFSRSHDRTRYSGIAFGLDREDYQDLFLDTWFKRNVWGLSRPVKDAGEVMSTRQMVEVAELKRTEIYADYLDRRDLHEGLRLAIWSDEAGIQDVSLLRAWSAGPFEAAEFALAGRLLPHLQRANAVARRLRHAEAASEGGLLALEAAGLAFVMLDQTGRPAFMNAPAERLVRERDGLLVQNGELHAADRQADTECRRAIGRALRPEGLIRIGSTLRLPRASGGAPLVMSVLPLARPGEPGMLASSAVLLLVTDPDARGASARQLSTVFGLTEAEAEIAHLLLEGHDLREIALRKGRSIHTIRNHLARMMNKTDTTRQAQLLRLLSGIPGLRATPDEP